MTAAEPLDAGAFAAWRDDVVRALTASDPDPDWAAGGGAVDVPCGECVGCCSSSMFVHIGPDETDALAHIPRALLFAAPGRPKGHVVLGYDERGRCPMLGEHGCTIYEHRPRTCRMFDCRVFTAVDVDVHAEAAPGSRTLIAERVARWRFRFDSEEDRSARARVLAEAERLRASEGLDGLRLALAAVEASAR